MINFKQVVGFAFLPRIYTGVAKSILTAMGIVLNGILKGFIDLHKKIDDDLSITPQAQLHLGLYASTILAQSRRAARNLAISIK